MADREITLTLEEASLAKVEQIAARNKTSVNEMVSKFLTLVASVDRPIDLTELPPITRRLAGILKDLPDKPYKDLVAEALAEKYGAK